MLNTPLFAYSLSYLIVGSKERYEALHSKEHITKFVDPPRGEMENDNALEGRSAPAIIL